MLDLFPTLFGKQYTPDVQEAWKKMLDLIYSKIYQVYANWDESYDSWIVIDESVTCIPFFEDNIYKKF